jgi:glycosyltransferase involved in cell wall biosynthesis
MGGIADMVTDGESALVVPAGDVEATATALRRFVGDQGLRESLAAGARRRVRPYLQSAVADTFAGIYEELRVRRAP